ncbi:MAG: hypothetical protein C5B58_00860 [Acidobacteria bacterium]|nr:MAG: hypothetical protein C5B58_00860 [Acidobacteriota bacterium]
MNVSLPVFAYWHSEDRSPLAGFLADWRTHFPDVRVISDTDVEPLIGRIGPGCIALYRRIRFPTTKSDIARLAYLHEFGGLYVDCHCGLRSAKVVRELVNQLSRHELVMWENSRISWPRPKNTMKVITGILLARPRSSIVLEFLLNGLANLEAHSRREASEGMVEYSPWYLCGAGSYLEHLCVPGSANTHLRSEFSGRIFFTELDGGPIAINQHVGYKSDPKQHWSYRRLHELLFEAEGYNTIKSSSCASAPLVSGTLRTKTALVIVGMHRSGTSALARVLNLLGADLPNNLLPANEHNAAGYWESYELMTMHDEMLEAAGTNWQDTGPIPQVWHHQLFIGRHRARIVKELKTQYANSTVMVVKDPRVSRFVPLIAAALQEIDVVPKFIISFRNPLEVADSLKARDGIPLLKSLLLWLDYTLRSEQGTRGFQRAFVCYDDLITDWRQTIRAAAARLDVAFPTWNTAAEAEIQAFLQPTLRHHIYSCKDLEVREDISDWIKTTFKAVRALSHGGGADEMALLDRVFEAFKEGQSTFGLLLAQAERSNTYLSQELKDLATMGEERITALEAGLSVERQLATQREHRIVALETELSVARQLATQREYRIGAILNSNSWRITAPLRWLRRHLPLRR